LGDVLVFGGGVIPTVDVVTLKEQGVSAVFTPGSSLKDICRWLEEALDAKEA
jgi:methylmalonyl-CoA mutase C-terminal domain/subunit